MDEKIRAAAEAHGILRGDTFVSITGLEAFYLAAQKEMRDLAVSTCKGALTLEQATRWIQELPPAPKD